MSSIALEFSSLLAQTISFFMICVVMYVCMWKPEINHHSPAVYIEWSGLNLELANWARMTGQQVPWTHLSPFSTKTTGICFPAQPLCGFYRFESGSHTWVKRILPTETSPQLQLIVLFNRKHTHTYIYLACVHTQPDTIHAIHYFTHIIPHCISCISRPSIPALN